MNVADPSQTQLAPTATFDDQGLYFSLILCAVLLGVFVPLVSLLMSTKRLWVTRLYRTNHTAEPEPASPCGYNGSAAATSPPLRSMSDNNVHEYTQTVRSPTGQRERVTRRKRLGVSLPYPASFLTPLSWRDWFRIDEAVPHLADGITEGALTPPTRIAGGAPSSAPLYSPSMPPPSGPRQPSTSPTQNSHSPRSPTLQGATERNVTVMGPSTSFDDDGHAQCLTSAEMDHHGRPLSYGAMAPPDHHGATRCLTEEIDDPTPSHHMPNDGLPKTARDPQVSLYLFTLKYFATFMLLGEFFTIWICVVASTGDYNEYMLVSYDTHKCHQSDLNLTECAGKLPYCSYSVDGGCAPVPLPGLYDLTVKNLAPRDAKWYPVVLLNLGFCASIVICTLYYVRVVSEYVGKVSAYQLQHALGYRVVCIRGPDPEDTRSKDHFVKRYLQEDAYFPPIPSHRADSYDEDEDCYETVSCSGLGCLFGTMGFHYYTTYRSDAVFTQAGKIKQILFTREPLWGMYRAMHHTESALADLQNAIAEEKALRRKQYYAQGGVVVPQTPLYGYRRHRPSFYIAVDNAAAPPDGNAAAVPGDIHVQGDAPDDLMTCAPFPSCCHKIPAVPYYEERFIRRAERLNQMIAQVPLQPTSSATFVVFADCISAFEFANLFSIQFGGCAKTATARIAGPPGEIISNNLQSQKHLLGCRFIILSILFVILIFTYSIPIGFLGSLDSLAYLPWFGESFLLLYKTEVPDKMRGAINAFLPVIVLAIFNTFLPDIIHFFVIAMGAFNRTDCEGGHLYLQYLFMVLTAVIFQAALQGGFEQLSLIVSSAESGSVADFFVNCVTPNTGGYFYAKVLTSIGMSVWLDILDPVALLKALFLRGRAQVQRNYDALFMPCERDLPRRYAFDLTLLAIGILFHMTVPLLGLFVALYFLVRYWATRSRLYDRYRPTLPTSQQCTDFGISAQVLRSVMWLYCLAETGGVLLLSLRGHQDGVIFCSISLVIGLVLLGYVNVATRRWTATLGRVRSLSRRGVLRPAGPVAASGSPQQSAAPMPAAHEGGSGSHSPTTQVHAQRTVYDDDNALDDSFGPDGEDAGDDREEAMMDAYENVRFTVFDTVHNQNPFVGHLLPRLPDVRYRYQPKHQRLALIDVDAEVQKLYEAQFVVERFWDKGMTWFEADVREAGEESSHQEPAKRAGASRVAEGLSSPSALCPPPPLPSAATAADDGLAPLPTGASSGGGEAVAALVQPHAMPRRGSWSHLVDASSVPLSPASVQSSPAYGTAAGGHEEGRSLDNSAEAVASPMEKLQ